MSEQWTPPPSPTAAPANVPNYLIPAILSLFCCWPLVDRSDHLCRPGERKSSRRRHHRAPWMPRRKQSSLASSQSALAVAGD